jgi:hypothetical protein
MRVAAVAALVVFASGAAFAQTTPAAQPAPPLESGDTAPAPGAPPPAAAPPASEPVTPLTTTGAPAPGAAAPAATAAVEPLIVPPPPAPRRIPIYRRDWFWGAIGIVVVTGMVVLALTLSGGDPSTPNTRLGDMRAF